MNTQINITQNGTTTLATAGKYCDRNIDVIVDIPTSTADIDSVIARTATTYTNDSATSIGQYAFFNYAGLTSVDFASVETVNDYAFENCTGLATTNFPSLTTTRPYAFQNSGITSITAENFPKLSALSLHTFDGCTSLQTVDLVNPIGYPSNYTFYGCTSLKSVKISSVKTVSLSMFGGCSALEVIDLVSVGSINGNAFNSTNLKTLIIRNPSKVASMTLTAINYTPIQNGTGYVYVPSALVDSYKTATNWSVVADQIRAIEDYPEITGG